MKKIINVELPNGHEINLEFEWHGGVIQILDICPHDRIDEIKIVEWLQSEKVSS